MNAATINSALLFVSTFALVFALGFQSLNVNGGHYKSAFATSLAIGVSQLVLYKLVPNASLVEVLAYLAGGPAAIVCSMLAHKWVFKAKPAAKADQAAPLQMACVCQWPPAAQLVESFEGDFQTKTWTFLISETTKISGGFYYLVPKADVDRLRSAA